MNRTAAISARLLSQKKKRGKGIPSPALGFCNSRQDGYQRALGSATAGRTVICFETLNSAPLSSRTLRVTV